MQLKSLRHPLTELPNPGHRSNATYKSMASTDFMRPLPYRSLPQSPNARGKMSFCSHGEDSRDRRVEKVKERRGGGEKVMNGWGKRKGGKGESHS